MDRHKWRDEYEAELRAVYEQEGKPVDEALIALILVAFDVGWYSVIQAAHELEKAAA